MKKNFIKDFSMVFFSNSVGLIISVIINLILPIVFKNSISSYGYIQLYLLYVSYYYLFDLGFCNGVYLKMGGKKYSNIDFPIYSGQFRVLVISQSLFAGIIILVAAILPINPNKKILAFMIAINIIIMQIKTYATIILQATNRMREYSISIIIVKLLNALAVLLALFVGIRDYRILIILLTIGEILSMLYTVVKCKEIVLVKSAPMSIVRKEIKENIRSGIYILSGAASMLMIGVARIAIENKWGIDTFAQISFTVSVSNMFMIFINAVSIVLYPKLRNIAGEKQIDLYLKMRDVLMGIMFVGICAYYPFRAILNHILPTYKESIMYMAILLPICLYTSKMSLLIQTYMKVLRLEKKIMYVNVVSLILSIILTIFSVYGLKNITFSVVVMLIAHMFRTIIAELILSRELDIYPIKDIIYELILTIIFIISNWFIQGVLGGIIFLINVLIYLIIKKKKILIGFKELL